MRPARLLVSLLVIFAFSSVAVAAAAPATPPARPITLSVKKISVKRSEDKKTVTFVRRMLTPLGAIEISQTDTGSYIRITPHGDGPPMTVRTKTDFLTFYDERHTNGSRVAEGYFVHTTLVVPVQEDSDGITCDAGPTAFIFLRPGLRPIVSRAYGSDCSERAFMTVTGAGSLTLTTWSHMKLEAKTYRYAHDAFALVSTQTPKAPPGYEPLITAQQPTTRKLVGTHFSMKLPRLAGPDAAPGFAALSRLYVDGIRQRNPDSYYIDGIAETTFSAADKEMAILEVTVDDADGSNLQVLEVGKSRIWYSRLFGIGSTYLDVFVRVKGSKIHFDLVGYNWPCRHTDCSQGDVADDAFRLYPVLDDLKPLLWHGHGTISLLGHGEKFGKIASASTDGPTLPASFRRALHNPPPRWFLMDDAGECVPAHPRTPAALIRRDLAQFALQDDVHVFQRKDGVPVGVKVGEPESGNMETVYTFFRTKAACRSYARARNQTLKSLQ